ncbi:hypothetical protein [Mycoplasma suis]|uniref:Uncharacterized protein n=2 Tax=Mycoplasma suis TaxID=57372 RepID=F0QQP0_MYCSL|nr:hypothetical protein [Mycoplasma suis]ADX97810.1 hypothetical protein MSU_0266 [Mycoplasma suis str. Illinois]CBZ40309.1 hypothetical protein MSUIS_02160 [Mycoplasma suis KI3806]
MLGSKLFLLGGGLLATGSSVGLGLKYLLGQNFEKFVPKVNYRKRIKPENESSSTEVSLEKIREVQENDLDWEYIFYYDQDKKKCEFDGKNSERWESNLGKECTTSWLSEKAKQWNKSNPNSKVELLIRRKKDFVYNHEPSHNGEENPRQWINYYLEEFKREKISLDFDDASDCNEINKNIGDQGSQSQWQEWSCYKAISRESN